MKEIKILIDNTSADFDRIMRLVQGATGCLTQKEDNTITIYSFDNMEVVIINTLVEDGKATLIYCKEIEL